MGTWEAITTRRNVREFNPEPLKPEHLERILEAAWRSPSSRNSQPWDFVVVTDRGYIIDFGYPAGGAPLKPIRKPDRRPFDEVVHRGSW